VGKLLRDNIIKNHIKKAVTVYKERRDHTFNLLSALTGYMECSKPEGGLAFWSVFDKNISLPALSAQCAAKNIYFSDGSLYNADSPSLNGCRMGFASMNKKETEIAVEVLATALAKL
jgi:GntR family transcriptional regulator/MocR family aminotransferase